MQVGSLVLKNDVLGFLENNGNPAKVRTADNEVVTIDPSDMYEVAKPHALALLLLTKILEKEAVNHDRL